MATLTTLATLATALAAMATRLTITVWRIHTHAHSERTAAAARLSLKHTVYLTDYARSSPGRGHLRISALHVSLSRHRKNKKEQTQ